MTTNANNHVIENPRIIIELQPNGLVTVTGPISQKILCLGMMEMAKTVIIDYGTKEESKITVPNLVDLTKFQPKERK